MKKVCREMMELFILDVFHSFFFFVVDGSVSRVEMDDVNVENVKFDEKRLILSGSRCDGEERKERIKRNGNPSLIFIECVFPSITSSGMNGGGLCLFLPSTFSVTLTDTRFHLCECSTEDDENLPEEWGY
jgi:hypothetical protein